jgi:hypothetical protein
MILMGSALNCFTFMNKLILRKKKPKIVADVPLLIATVQVMQIILESQMQ